MSSAVYPQANGRRRVVRERVLARLLPLCAVAFIACGARTRGNDPERRPRLGLVTQPRSLAPRTCATDADCAPDACASYRCSQGYCVEAARVECPASSDACTKNVCAPRSGRCEPENATPDLDQDGFFAARLGFTPGAEGACGDDCDDSHPGSNPYGVERCDGHDNDCDGSIDEGFQFLPPTESAVLISTGSSEAGLGGLLHNGELFVLSYSERRQRNRTLLLGMHSAAQIEFSADVALTNSDTYAGPVLWTGQSFVTAWEDRRHEDFEIYWNRFDADGVKLGPDLRLSNAIDFSLGPALAALGEDYVVFWQDRRESWRDYQIYAQRIDSRGELVGDNINVTTEYSDSEDPSIAVGDRELGLSFNTEADGRQVVFRTLSFDLATLGTPVVLSGPNSVGATVHYDAGKYIVLWREYDALPGDAIWGTVVTPEGVAGEPRRVTEAAEFARDHDLLPLGDRLLLLSSEFHDDGYQLFLRTLAPDLSPLSDAVQVTNSAADVVAGSMAIGDERLGLAFMSYESGAPQVYFTTLACH